MLSTKHKTSVLGMTFASRILKSGMVLNVFQNIQKESDGENSVSRFFTFIRFDNKHIFILDFRAVLFWYLLNCIFIHGLDRRPDVRRGSRGPGHDWLLLSSRLECEIGNYMQVTGQRSPAGTSLTAILNLLWWDVLCVESLDCVALLLRDIMRILINYRYSHLTLQSRHK